MFWYSKPNEQGDTLAGLFSGLALLWIVITVWLQSLELEAQREELVSTREELKLTRIAYEKQVAVTQTQLDILVDEQRERKQELIGRLVDQKLNELIADFKEQRSDVLLSMGYGITWDSQGKIRKLEARRSAIFPNPSDDGSPERFFRRLHGGLQLNIELLSEGSRYCIDPEQRFLDCAQLEKLVDQIGAVLHFEDQLSAVDAQRLRNAKLKELREALQLLIYKWEEFSSRDPASLTPTTE